MYNDLVQLPDSVIAQLSLMYNGYDMMDFTGIMIPKHVLHELERVLYPLDETKAKDIMNGCGSKGIGGYLVPDTILLLCVTPICNIHDMTHYMAQTPEDCDNSNILMLNNLIVFINNNSANFLTRIPRRYRATSYYSAVEEAKRKYCRGYRNNAS